MKLNKKFIAIPAIALAASLSLAACGSQAASHAAPAVTHTVTAPAATPKPAHTGGAAPATPAPRVIVVPAPVYAAPAPAPAQPAYFTDATSVVTQFYQDITDHNYSGAWALGGSIIGGGSYSGWVAGYSTTESVSLGTFSAFGSNQVRVRLTALQSGGWVKTYEGTYTVSGGVIVAASIVQTG